MSDSLNHIKEVFKGTFLTEPDIIRQKISTIKAYVFDWDGVFNSGEKDVDGNSSFNEVDSMGSNLLRYNHYLTRDENPLSVIISGEKNHGAMGFAKREHFHAVYSGAKNKLQALEHVCSHKNIKPEEVAFFFDDILDLSVAGVAGVRILISRKSNPLMSEYIMQHGLADYMTASDGGNCGLREGMELVMGLTGNYNNALGQRIQYSETYRKYIKERNSVDSCFYKVSDSKITEVTNP